MKKKYITFILIIVFNGAGLFHLRAQSNKEVTLEIFDLLFIPRNFDSKYYKQNLELITFPIIREGVIVPFLDSLNMNSDLLQLKNGNQLAFNLKGWMFMADIKYYLKFAQIVMGADECLIEIECIEFDGFTEKGLGNRKFRFQKKGDVWKNI